MRACRSRIWQCASWSSRMWDNPDSLNGCANALYVLAAAALIYAGAHVAIHSPLLPLRHLALQGELAHVTREQAEGAARLGAVGTFFSVDLDAVRRAFEALPWVRKVEVRRLWPDRIQVAIEEHVALARWGSDTPTKRLVNTYGEVFEAESSDAVRLPQFAGPAGELRQADGIGRFGLEHFAVGIDQALCRCIASPARQRHVLFYRDLDAVGPQAPHLDFAHPGEGLERAPHRVQFDAEEGADSARARGALRLFARDMRELALQREMAQRQQRRMDRHVRAGIDQGGRGERVESVGAAVQRIGVIPHARAPGCALPDPRTTGPHGAPPLAPASDRSCRARYSLQRTRACLRHRASDR